MGILKTDWEKDVVYLVQLPRAGCIPNLSPFALKLETWLRMANIKYENVSNEFTKQSVKGQIPFIELNGQQFADTNIIIEYLTRVFHVDFDQSLGERDRADARAYFHLIEESIRWCVIYNRSRNNKFFATSQGLINHFNGFTKFLFKHFLNERLRKSLMKTMHAQGYGRHSLDEIESICQRDLQALSTFLGDKRYLLGNNVTTLDATAFGHIAQAYWTPLLTENIHRFMDTATPNLVDYMNRIRQRYWSDWDDAIRLLSLNTKPALPN